jgi:hypothetical protein
MNREWCTPWKPGFRFIISRNVSRYSCISNIDLKVMDSFYNYITTLKLSEFDMLSFIDNIKFFLNDPEEDPEISITINFKMDSSGIMHYVELYRLCTQYNATYELDTLFDGDDVRIGFFDNVNNSYRDIKFTIYSYNYKEQFMSPVVTFFLSNEELESFSNFLYYNYNYDN